MPRIVIDQKLMEGRQRSTAWSGGMSDAEFYREMLRVIQKYDGYLESLLIWINRIGGSISIDDELNDLRAAGYEIECRLKALAKE